MRRLIVNADDFGFNSGVNAGVITAHKQGIVTSASLMANGDAFEEARELAVQNPSLDIGIHLSLIGGRPVSDPSMIRTLVDRNGLFPSNLLDFLLRLFTGRLNRKELGQEFRAQIRKVQQAGLNISHLDSHKHTHLHPWIFQMVAEAAREFRIPRVRKPFEHLTKEMSKMKNNFPATLKQHLLIRTSNVYEPSWTRICGEFGLHTPDYFFGFRNTGYWDALTLPVLIQGLPEGTAELMCHPGKHDETLAKASTRLKESRQRELDILTNPLIKDLLKQEKVQLVPYSSLVQPC